MAAGYQDFEIAQTKIMEHKHEEDQMSMGNNSSANEHVKHAMPAIPDHSNMDHNAMQHGASPSMGMAGHNHHAMMIADFKKRFYVVLILTVPIMLLSTMIQHFIGVNWHFTGSQYILFALSTIVFFYGGWPFLKGLLDEVKSLLPYRHFNALRTVGYTELFDYLDGKISLEDAVALIKQNTRQYAKRQITWFKKDRSVEWMEPGEPLVRSIS